MCVARGLVTDNFEADLPRTGVCEDPLSGCDTLVMSHESFLPLRL